MRRTLRNIFAWPTYVRSSLNWRHVLHSALIPQEFAGCGRRRTHDISHHPSVYLILGVGRGAAAAKR